MISPFIKHRKMAPHLGLRVNTQGRIKSRAEGGCYGQGIEAAVIRIRLFLHIRPLNMDLWLLGVQLPGQLLPQFARGLPSVEAVIYTDSSWNTTEIRNTNPGIIKNIYYLDKRTIRCAKKVAGIILKKGNVLQTMNSKLLA